MLTLILSLQASYAAPLILLAQNRQADRDRISQEEDRTQNERLQADVEYLTRELAALRLSLGEVATRDFLRDQLRDLTEEIVARTSEGDYDQEAQGAARGARQAGRAQAAAGRAARAQQHQPVQPLYRRRKRWVTHDDEATRRDPVAGASARSSSSRAC